MEQSLKILTLLENAHFNANADIAVLAVASDLVYTSNQNFWKRGTKERAQLIELITGKMALSTEAFVKSGQLNNLVAFVQGLLLITISLVNGLGRSPITVQRKDQELLIKFAGKPQPIKCTVGLCDAGFGKLVKEFKILFYGKALDESISKNELYIIKETLKETNSRLKNEKSFIEKVSRDPLLFFKHENQTFANGLFLILSALPMDTLNNLLLHIGSYIPDDLEEINEDQFKINVRSYLTTSTMDLHELFKKIRILLKLYYGKQRQIIAIIVKEKVKDYFEKNINTRTVLEQIKQHLKTTAENQFKLRITIFEGLIKLL